MPEEEPIATTEQEMQSAAEVLRAVQDCERFQMDFDDATGNRIELLYGNGLSAKRHIPTEDFLKAVDYYYENRDSEGEVDLAMRQPDGVVNVWSPFNGADKERTVVVSIKNYKVPQILEFAYLIVRNRQKQKN